MDNVIARFLARVGSVTLEVLEEQGYVFMLGLEIAFWTFAGWFIHQPLRIGAVASEALGVGVRAVPIVSVLCLAVGVMLAIQGISALRPYGAETQVVAAIALSVTREFSPLIVGVLVAGRSGSAMTARIGTMMESQEIDALRVIGVNPVRFLGAPMMLGTLIAVPALTIVGDYMGVLGGGIYAALELHLPLEVYVEESIRSLVVDDVRQGLIKSTVFAFIIALVGVSNGFQVRGGAEGVGRATTRSVVVAISLIVMADMIFTYFLNQ